MPAKFEIYKDKSKVTDRPRVPLETYPYEWTGHRELGEGYKAKANAMNGINSVKENAASATVEDKTV